MRRLRVGSLCSGYGGLEMGISMVFPRTKLEFVADNDPAVSRILEHRYPYVPNIADITLVKGDELPPVHILAAGFPCQPFSDLGHRKGMDDERYLFDEITRLISEMPVKPGILIFENVASLRWNNDGHTFYRVLSSLSRLGYVGSYGVFRASDAGAPHQRERIFITAIAPDSPGLASRIQDASAYTFSEQRQARSLLGQRTVRASEGSFWGAYGNAVWLWEGITGFSAPFPLIPSESGEPYTNPRFVEWIMGLPAGWVTDVPGLSWEEQIHALGNGVVPQQAALAVSELLTWNANVELGK